MATIPASTVSNTCGGWLRARDRDNNQQPNRRTGTCISVEGRARCRVPNIWDMTAHVPPVISELSRAEAMCLRLADGSIDLVTKPAREKNFLA
jgi:hypothetical protein